VTLQATNGHYFRWLISCLVSFTLWSGCSLQPLQQQPFGDLGHIDYRKSSSHRHGVVVGVPHGVTEAAAIDYATEISDQTDAALVVAYGFRAKRIAVSQPLVHSVPFASGADSPSGRGSIYPEFKALLRKTAHGPIKFYVGVRIAAENSDRDRIEAVSTGLTFEQLSVLEKSFERIRDQTIGGTKLPAVDLALDPLDKISWQAGGVKHHGVLMLAEKGLDVSLPPRLAATPAKPIYVKIFSRWVRESLSLIENNPARLPQTEITVLDLGKIESIPGRQKSGIVIGAPHGTFDFYTAGTVREICFRTGLAAVIATGFTPTESGDGWRINVNRPSERHASLTLPEKETARARTAYKQFKDSVLRTARGELALYIDIHQNAGSRIEVASVGISKTQASFIKETYRGLRDRTLAEQPDIVAVDLAIEPLDEIEVGAWAAKANGILSVAKKSLHFELPSDGIMATSRQRAIYTSILAELVRRIAERLAVPSD
jgi:hypothetical protein